MSNSYKKGKITSNEGASRFLNKINKIAVRYVAINFDRKLSLSTSL